MSTRTISTLEELKAFRDEVNAGNTFKGETIELANDIDLGGEEWTPIGHYQGGSFNGTFNGNGHTIKGLNIGNQSYSGGTGFFGETFTAVIKDLTIEGNINTNTDYVGGIVGHGYATITNCNFIGSIRTSSYQVGGIAGSGGFTITNCTVDGNISGASWVGGIVGNCQDGGAYTNCYVKGEISADFAYYGVGAAGIAAIPLYTSQAISNCYSDTVTKNGGKEVNAPIIGVYNDTVTADTKTFLTNNSWNKEKNSNDTFGICGGDNADPTVPVNNVSRSNNLIAVASDLLYVEPGTLTIAHGTSLTQEEILDTLNNTGDETKGAVVDPDGTIRFVNYVASINGTKYETLGAALAAAQDGDTITLLSDISLDQTLTIDKTVTIESAAGSAFTIKAGPSMVATSFNSMALLNIKNAGVSLKNLTLDGNAQSGMTLIWTNQAKGLTLDTCTLKNSRNAIYAGTYNGGTLKINACNIIAQIYAINGSGMDKIEVTDSKLYGWTSFNSTNADAEALFRNCFFGAGDDTGKNGLVAALRPYFNAVVEGCTFTEAFSKFTEGYYEENGLSLGTPNAVMDLTNCKIVTETGDPSTLALAKLISTKYDAAAGNAKPNTAFAFDAVKDENGKYISGIFCGDSEVITKNLAAGLAAVANEDGTYTPTAVDMNTLLVNEKWAETYKVGDLIQEGFYFGVNAFAKANDAINAAGANATIKIQDARDYNTPITKASYTENLTIESQENSYSQLYMTVSGKTYTYGEEDKNGNAVRHDATVEYKGQDIFFGGHSHFESLAGMTVKFTSTEVTHEGGTPFFKVYGDSNVVFDGANYANDNGNLWFYVSGQLDLQNSSYLETDGGSGFRILAAGGKVNVDKSSLLRVSGSNISIGSYYVYSDKTAKAVVGGKKQGHDADGNNDYSATLNITNGAGLVNNGIVRVGASYILDNATTDELEGLTITNNPDKPANYADLAKAYLNISNASAAELDRLYVDGNGTVTIRNSTLTANSITLADGSSLTLDTAATVTVGALTAANGTITIDASSYTSGLYKLIDVTGYGKVDYSKILTAFGENLTVIDNDLWIGAVDRSTILVDSSFAGKYNAGEAIVGREGFFYGFNAFATAKEASAYWNGTIELIPGSAADESLSSSNIELKNQNLDLTLTGKAPEHQFPFFKLDNSDSNFKSSLAVKDAEFAWSKLDIRRNATATITDSSIDFEFPSDKHLNPTIGVYYNGKVDIARSTITDGQMSITGELNLDKNSTWLNYASSQIAENGIVTVSNGSKLILSKTAIGKAYEGRVNPNRDEKLAELVVDNAELATRDDAYYYEVTSFTLGDGGEYAGKITLRNGATATLGYRESMLINSNGTIDIDNATLIIPEQRTILSGSTESLAELVNNGTINVTGNSKVNIWKMSGNAVNLKDATLTDSKLGNVKVYGTNSVTDTELGNVNIGYGMDDSTESAKLSVIGNSKLGYTYVGQDNVSDSVYSLTFTTAEGQQATVDQMYIRQNGEVTVSKASNVKTSYIDLGGTLKLNEGAVLENTHVNMFIRGRAEKNANGKAQLLINKGARFNHSATGPNALLVVGGVNGDGPATASGLIYMTGEGSYFEAESVQLKDKTDATIGEIAFKLYDGATAVIRDTITVGKGTELLISGSNLGACSVIAKNVIHNGEMTICGWSELTAENITVSAGAKIWGMSGSMITVTNSLVVENYGDLYFTIGTVAGDVDVVALIKGYEGIDYTNVDVTSSEGYVKVVGNDNNLYAMRGDSSTLYANAAWTGHEMGTAVDGIAGTVYGFNAFASAETMFDNIRDTTTTLKLFGEQELVTDAATGAANNRNFNIRAKQDLTLTADEAAKLTLTVKDSSWTHGGSTNNVGELAFLSDSDDAVQTITIGENVTIDTNAKIWFGRTAVTKEVHATNVIINGSIIQKPHKDATSEHPNASLYGIHQIQVEKGSTVTLNGSMLFGWSLLVKGGTFNVTENASLTWDVDAFAQTNGNVEVESRQETGGQFNVSGSKNVNLRSLTIKDGASSASFTNGAEAIFIDYITLAEGSSITVDAASTVTTGTLTNNGELVIYESTLKAMTITNNNYFAINKNSAITAEFSAAGTGFISMQDAVFGADTVINASASYTNQGIGSEIVMFGENLLANGANISTGWSKNLRIGFGTNFPSAAISITSGAKLTVGGSTYIGSATEDQGDAAYWVLVTGAGSEFNGSGASGDLYLRADGMLTIQNKASASFSYFNGKGVLNVLKATFKSLNFNIADSAKLSFANGAKVTLGNTATASTAKGDISVGGDETELNLIGDIKYGRTNTAADFTVKNNATVTVDGNIELGYFTQVSGVMFFYKSNLSLTDNAKFTTAGTITVFLNSAIAMDYTSRLTFGGLTTPNGAITIDVSGYTDGIYKVMENTGSNAVDYTTVISNWSEIENIGYTIVDNALYIGKADSENYLVNADYSKYKFGDAIEGKTGYFYGFNAFSSLDDAGRAAKEATKTITVEADLTEDVNTPLFDLKGDLILTAESPVTVTWNVIGNAADAPDTDGKFYLVSKDGLNHTFTIGENVTLNVPQSSYGGAFYVGYQSIWATKLNIDGKVNTYLFYIGSKSEVTISETGSLTTTSENLIMRWDSKLTVNGNGTLDENNPQVKLSYASIQGGDLVLNNTVMNAGSWLQMWNRNKVDGKQAPTLTLNNSILIASGLTASDAEEAVISLNNNSTVKINGNAANAGTMSVTDSVLNVDGTLTNSGTINVYGESTINTVGVANTGMIILNDGTTLVDSTIMDSTENTVAYGNVTVRDSYFGTLVFSGNSGASVNGTLEGLVVVDKLMVDRRYNDAVSDDITGTLTVKAGASVGVNDRMYNKVGSTTVIEANATVTVFGELQNKGTFNVEGYLYLYSENGLGESVAGRDKNKGVMNVNGGNVYYEDDSSSNGWFGIGAKIHNAGWQDVEEAGSEMNLSNNAVLGLTFNSSNGYPTKYGAAFAIGTGATLNVESGSTVNANSELLNKGTVNLDETSKITVGDLINEATGKINVKAGTDVSFKAGALTNKGEFAVDGGSYQGGTVKVIDLDSITGAEINVTNIDSKYVYRGDDGDVLFSDASKEILKGNTKWTEEFGEAVAGVGDGFYMGVNAFNNADKLSAEFKRDESVKEIQLAERLTGKLALERGVTISSDRFFGEEATLGGTDAEYTLNVSYNQTWERFEIGGQNVTVTLNDNGSASLQAHTLNIGSGAEVIVTDGATLYASEINTSGAITGGTLNNWGTITLEAGSALQVGRSAVAGWFNNYGLINVNDATITVFAANFKNEGTITVSAGSTVETSEFFINQGTFNLNWNATLKIGNFDATSSSITIDMTGFDNKEHALVVVNNTTLDETAVISIVGQDFYNKYKGYLRYDGNTLYLTENLSAEVYVSSSWAGKGQGETVDYNGNTYTIGTNAFGTVEEAKAVNPLLIHIVDGTISKTALEGVKTVLEGDATYTGVITAGTRVNDGVDNRRTVDGDTNVTVNGGTFRSHLIGADSQISGSIRRNGNVTLTINGGDFEKQVAGGMYFYAQNPFDEAVLNGDVNMTINGGTFVKRVYGGCFTQLENEYTAQTKIVGDINLTIDASVNTITFNNMVTAGSRGTGRIYGDINVKVTGAGSNLNFTTKLIGDSNAAGYYNTASGYTEQTYVSGDRIVEFANFQGDFNAELIMFKTLNFSERTNMTFTSVRLDVSNVSEWNFGFGTELNINAGLNSFEGDELAFGLDGWDNSSDWTAINGAKDSMIAGWDKAGSVSFILNGSEYAASWDAAAGAWCNSELGVKLGLGNDQKSLLISKLA